MKTALISILVACLASPTIAQSPPNEADWDMVRDPATKTTMAVLTTTTGVNMAVRCVDGAFNAVLAGLPVAAAGQEHRTLRLQFRNDDPFESRWTLTTDRSVVVADFPAAFARDVRDGGRLQITVPDGAGPGRNMRYDLTLPPSTAAIDEVLSVCGRPSVDPRDAATLDIGAGGLPEGMTWARPPRPRFPATQYASGQVVLTCLVNPDASLSDCLIESEHPGDGRFGQAALRAMPQARVASRGETEGQYVRRMVALRVNFRTN
jgi:hypothetical protein